MSLVLMRARIQVAQVAVQCVDRDRMRFTDEELDEAEKRLDAERKAQGLPLAVVDPVILARLADWLDPPVDEDPIGIDPSTAVRSAVAD